MPKTKEQLNVTQEALPGSQLGLDIEIPGTRSRAAYDKIVNRFMRTADIPGFRRGKVPKQVILQRFGAGQLKAAALEELIEQTFREALEQEEIDALGNFALKSSFEELVDQFNPGEPITFSASIDVTPEIKLKRYTGFEISAEEVKYDPQKVESVLEEQRSARATLVPVEDRDAAAGDVAIVDFSGNYFEDGSDEPKEIEGGSASDFQIELTEGQFIPGFVEGIIGMTPGTTKEIEVAFPDEYFQEELAGKAAKFSITLHELKAKELPELDDDFAQEVSEFDTLAELREFLEDRYKEEAQTQTDTNVETALLDALVEELEADVPESLVTNESSFLINQMASRLQAQGIDVNKLITKDTIPNLRERFHDEAVTRVKRTLALGQVAETESIEITAEDLEKRFQEVISQAGDRDLDQDRLKEVLEEELIQDKVIAWLKEHSEITLTEPGDKADTATETKEAPKDSTDDAADAEDTAAKTEDSAPKKTTKKSKASTADSGTAKKTTRRKSTTKAKKDDSDS